MGARTWTGVALVAGALAATAACELIEECDPATDPDCVDLPPETTPPDDGTDHYQTYFYVLVRDMEDSQPNSYGTNGADIDGVELRHGSSANFADHVDALGFGSGETQFTDQNQTLGAPEGTCEEGTFVSLGGTGGTTGGYLIFSFYDALQAELQEIVDGDALVVHECGDTPEEYSVYVGVEPDLTSPHWYPCGEYLAGVSQCVVQGLPLIPVE